MLIFLVLTCFGISEKVLKCCDVAINIFRNAQDVFGTLSALTQCLSNRLDMLLRGSPLNFHSCLHNSWGEVYLESRSPKSEALEVAWNS